MTDQTMRGATRAVVSLSGGQDSTTCLFAAKRRGFEVHAVTFDYHQRHSAELIAAQKIAGMAGVASHEIIRLPAGVLKSTSPLVDHSAQVEHYSNVEKMPKGIEPTFVPARNILFAVLLANRAVAVGASAIYLGVCEEDFGGYPDCRREFIDAMEYALDLGIFGIRESFDPQGVRIRIETPLMHLTKRDSVLLAAQLPGCMDALAYSHTCYDGAYPPNPRNHASMLRARGFHEAGLPDPLIVRAKREGLLASDYPDSGYLADSVRS